VSLCIRVSEFKVGGDYRTAVVRCSNCIAQNRICLLELC
jgi:hypothetical protein